MHQVPSAFTGAAEVVAVLVLLSTFAMLRAPMLGSQVRLYALQSLATAALAAVVAATRDANDLYALAGLSAVLKVIIVPAIMLRLLRDTEDDLTHSWSAGVTTMALVAIAVSVFGFLAMSTLHLNGTDLPTAALGTAMAVVLVSFVLIIFRSDVASQAIGFFSLENGVSVASLVLASRLPFLLEVAFLFDLLVAVVAFGMISRVHHARGQTLSTEALQRLKG